MSESMKKILIIGTIFVMIDQIFFGKFLWEIPSEASWGTDFFYNYNYEKKRLEKGKEKRERIILLGSSVARYSFDSLRLEDYFKKAGVEREVRLLSHAGMTPIDAYCQRDAIEKMQPSLLVYPLNFVDFRIFRAFELFAEKKLEEVEEKDLIKDALDPRYAPQSRFIYPGEALIDFYDYLDLESSTVLLSSTLFPFYRYREIAYDNLRYIYNHRYSRNTSYYWYQGIQIPERVSTLGWTGKKFSFEFKKYMKEEGFFLQIVPEIIKKGELKIRFLSDNRPIEEFIFSKTGWQRVKLQNFIVGDRVTAELSETWIPYKATEDRFDYAKEEMGVRLQETFGLESPHKNFHIIREERSEDMRFETMTEEDYSNYFQFRLLQDREKRPGLVTMTLYKDAKLRLHTEKFRPFFHYKYLKKFVEEMQKRNIPTLLILNPENPNSLIWYKDSQYVKDEKKFFLDLEDKQVYFWDIHSFLQGKDFSDYHHLTYRGAQKMNSIYGEKILEIISKLRKN